MSFVAWMLAVAIEQGPAKLTEGGVQYEQGFSYRLYQINEELVELASVVPGQSPNLAFRHSRLNYPLSQEFGATGRFVVQCSGYILAPKDGDYGFLLTSGEGARLTIGGRTMIENDGLQPTRGQRGIAKLKKGLNPFLIDYFEGEGEAALRLEWKRPGDDLYAQVPEENLWRRESDALVTAPGLKQVQMAGGPLRPGTGQPLQKSHPGWREERVGPAGWRPDLQSIKALPGGRLVVTGQNKVWLIGKLGAENPANIVVREVRPAEAEGREGPVSFVYEEPASKIGSGRIVSLGDSSKTAIWIPGEELTRSATGPLAHRGQNWVADESGAIHRVIFDAVRGENQGAILRQSQGASPIRGLAESTEGRLFAATRNGLVRVSPTGKSAFEINSIKAIGGGFRVTLNRPVPLKNLGDRKQYSAQSWRYLASNEAAGRVDMKRLRVAAANPLASRSGVDLKIDGLEEDSVVRLRMNLSSDQGTPIWVGETWYTVNRLVNPPKAQTPMKILVFSRTKGFRHDSIETGAKCLEEIGKANGFVADWTEDPTQFNDENLSKYQVVVFLNTTGDVLDKTQEDAFERFIRKGRGFVGVHAASDTEYDWKFYGDLVGAYFMSHPAIQQATIKVVDRTHPSTRHLGENWVRRDEWYDFRAAPNPSIKRLLNLDQSTYTGAKMPGEHPIAWCHEFAGGRSFYTGGGHTKESYAEPDFRQHLLGGILWAARKK